MRRANCAQRKTGVIFNGTQCNITENGRSCDAIKGKVNPRTGHEGPEGEERYSSILSLTSALDGVGWSTPRPGRFTLGKDTVPIVQEAGWAPRPVCTGAENIAPPSGFDPQTFQPVTSRYTD